MGKGTKVRDIMHAEVVTAGPETSVNSMARLMAARGISGIPIVEDDRIVGIVTELDLIERNTRFEGPAFFQILDTADELKRIADRLDGGIG